MAQLRATAQQRIDELPASSVFALRYRIVRRIGTGGFGAVYEAQHVVTGRRCALKLLWPHLAGDEAFRKRFLQEARLATQLQSEHIVDVLDAGIDGETDTPFLVMEYLDGEDLSTRVKRKQRFSPEETIIYLSQLAVGLDRTHAASIIHRDLKPENLFLTKWSDGSPLVKILDFGIAKLVAEQSMQGPTASAGTPLYMAPEQFQHGPATPAVDIYALGMIAFRFLVGRHYYAEERRQSENAYALLLRLSQGPAEAATARAARWGVELPAAFDGWFRQCTHADHGQRFGSAVAAVIALARALGVQPREPLLTKQKPRLTGALTHGIQTMEGAAPHSTQALRPEAGVPQVESRRAGTEAGAPPTQPYSSRSPEAPVLAATVLEDSSPRRSDEVLPTVSSSLLETVPVSTIVPSGTSSPSGVAGSFMPLTASSSVAPAPPRRTLAWLVAALGLAVAFVALGAVVVVAMRPAPKTAQIEKLRLDDKTRVRLTSAARPPPAAQPEPPPHVTRPASKPVTAAPPAKSAQPEAATSESPADLYSRE